MNDSLKILYLQTDIPYPLNGGGRLRSYHLLRELAKTNAVTLISFADAATTSGDIREMERFCRKVVAVPFQRKNSPAKMLRSLAGGGPYKVLQYASAEFAGAVNAAWAESEFDLVFSEHPYLAQYIPPDARCVLPQNIEMMATILKRTADSGTPLMRLYAGTQWNKMRNYELDLFRRYGVCVALTREDEETIKELVPGILTVYIPNGVDTEYYVPGTDVPETGGKNIVFAGVYSYYPNEQAVLYFAAEILPLVRERYPDVRFTIVGKDPGRRVRSLAADPNITVTGPVNDVRPYICGASLVAIPLLIGGGTRTKILEAFALGKPVVSTSVGCEGLEVEPDKHLLVADSPREFADAAIRLLGDRPLAGRLGAEGRRLVEERYRWEAVGRSLDAFVHELVNGRRRVRTGESAR